MEFEKSGFSVIKNLTTLSLEKEFGIFNNKQDFKAKPENNL